MKVTLPVVAVVIRGRVTCFLKWLSVKAFKTALLIIFNEAV